MKEKWGQKDMFGDGLRANAVPTAGVRRVIVF
jgi:hypothetical protein